MLLLDIKSASVCKAAGNAVRELFVTEPKKVLKNVLEYILSIYVFST